MPYLSNGKLTSIYSKDDLPFDREFAHELAEVFRRYTGMEFKQSRFTLLPSETQNDLVHQAAVNVQDNRKRRKQV